MSATGSARRGRPVAEAGFTLIEMLVVIAVAGLVAGILFPRVDALIAHQSFRAAESSVLLGLTAARARAIRSGRVNAFAPGADGRSFATAPNDVAALPDGIRLSATQVAVRFFSDGSSDAATLTLTGAREQSRLVIAPDTGTIAIVR